MNNKYSLPDINKEILSIKPLEQAETIPSSWYINPQFHEFEKDAVFSKNWIYAGHTSQLPKAGDYILTEIAANPVIIVNSGDKELNHGIKAFYNVCRHRGGPLALDTAEGTGSCSNNVLQCKYHGWTYKLDGSLRGVPRFDRVDLFDKKDYGLIPLSVSIVEGLIFICITPVSEDAGHLLNGIPGRISPFELKTKKFAKRVVYNVSCNWKVYIDNYLEGYHLPYVHPELCTLLDYRNYVTETYDYYSLQHSPLKGESNFYGNGEGNAFYYFIFPNLMLNILPGRLQTNLVLPAKHDKTKVIFDYFYDTPDSAGTQEIIKEDIEYSHKVQIEDIEICEYVQRGLSSQGYDRGRFSVECENGVYHFQNLLKKAYYEALQ